MNDHVVASNGLVYDLFVGDAAPDCSYVAGDRTDVPLGLGGVRVEDGYVVPGADPPVGQMTPLEPGSSGD